MNGIPASQFFADYSVRDHEIVDYDYYRLDGLPSIGFRGPPVPKAALESGEYCTVMGAAQAFGVYIEKPFPALISERLGLPCLNLSTGGGTAGFFANQPQLIDIANRGRFLILQIMTARTEGNSRAEPIGVNFVRDAETGEEMMTEAFWLGMLKRERAAVPGLIAESVQNWRRSYRRLIEQIKVPVILLYFSTKPDDEKVNYDATNRVEFYGSFPQFVDIDAVRDIAPLCDAFVECRSSRGFPHPLISRFTGKPVTVDFGVMHESMGEELFSMNDYYPSAEMHEDAFIALAPRIEAILART